MKFARCERRLSGSWEIPQRFEDANMARFKTGFDDSPRPATGKLVERLVEEFKSDRKSGQPFIYEQTFSSGRVRILVVWDDWKHVPLEGRTSIIHSAVERSDGKECREKIALASGLTVPEASLAGMLPYHVFPSLRKSNTVTQDECRDAMLSEGATKLLGPTNIQLRVATQEAADDAVRRLVEKLPKSEEVWVVTRDSMSQEFAYDDDGAVAEI